MCAPACCSALATSGRAAGAGVLFVPVLALVGAGLVHRLGWPIVVLALAGAVATTGGALWLIVAAARLLDSAAHRQCVPAERAAGRESAGVWRVHAIATDLPRQPRRAGSRVLTGAEVEALSAQPPHTTYPPALPRSIQRATATPVRDQIVPSRPPTRHYDVLPAVATWPLCLPSDGPWPLLALVGLGAAAWMLGRREAPPRGQRTSSGSAAPARSVSTLSVRTGGNR